MREPLLSQYLLAQKYNPQMQWDKLYPEFFVYQMDFGTIAAGASDSRTLQIQADASFLLLDLAGTLFNANTGSASFGNTQVIDAVLNLQDTGSGKNLMSSPVQFAHLFGQNGENTYSLPVPRILQNNSTLVATLTNNTAWNITKASMSFLGVKLLNKR